jgi:hypothetical protein
LISFLHECHRVLAPNGVLRVAVPSIVRVTERGTQAYFEWVKKKGWAEEASLKGALGALIYQHGHETVWDAPLLRATLAAAGFRHSVECEVGQSSHAVLCGVEGHGRIIGDDFNSIETVVCEATK